MCSNGGVFCCLIRGSKAGYHSTCHGRPLEWGIFPMSFLPQLRDTVRRVIRRWWRQRERRPQQQTKRILPTTPALVLAPVAYAGVPEQHKAANSKWMQINPAWAVDTADIEVRGDQICFWFECSATKEDTIEDHIASSSTEKMCIRCGDYHFKGCPGVTTYYYRMPVGHNYQGGTWEAIRSKYFANTLASNFCYSSGTAGYTPEPIERKSQQKITVMIKMHQRKSPAQHVMPAIMARFTLAVGDQKSLT